MTLLANDVGAILGDAGMTTLIGIAVVFGVLVLLVTVFTIFGSIMSRVGSEEKVAPAAAPAAVPAPVAAPIVGNTETVRTSPEVQNGIPAETVAAISGAVAAMAPAGKQYAVQGIRKL